MLPELADWLGQGGELIHDVISVIPSVSLASHATLLTGQPPRRHGIPAHLWMHPVSRQVVNYQTRAVRRLNSDLTPGTATVFEYYPDSTATQTLVTRGASSVTRLATQNSLRLLRRMTSQLRRTPWGLHVCWLPAGDTAAHRFGPDSVEVAREMRTVSTAVGELLDELQKLGVRQRTSLVLVPDHGHRRSLTSTPLQRVQNALRDVAPTWDVRVNPVVALGPTAPDDVVALTSGGSSLHVYPPDHLGPRGAGELIEAMSGCGEFGLVVGQLTDSSHLVASADGTARLEWQDGKTDAHYTVTSGSDPLRLALDESGTIDLDTPRLDQPYPDFVAQYLSSIVPGRSAPILAFAQPNRYFTTGPRPAWRFGFHRGSHGGPLADEVLVSAIVQRAEARAGEMPNGPVRSRDLLRFCGILPLLDGPS